MGSMVGRGGLLVGEVELAGACARAAGGDVLSIHRFKLYRPDGVSCMVPAWV